MQLKTLIRELPNFPLPGVLFRDISPILESPEAFAYALDQMVAQTQLDEIDHFVGIESRGFILGAALATRFKKGFIPLRKAGKLPPPVHSYRYKLEYGEAALEMRSGSGRVYLVDDVLATGGTLGAGIELCTRAGYIVKDVGVLVDLRGLNQFRFNGKTVHSVLQYE
jgi:adenine phosphoribosyltransferase